MTTLVINSFNNKTVIYTAVFLCILAMASACRAQEGESYWTLLEIRKVSGKAMHGATLANIEDIATKNPYFKRTANEFVFDFPVTKKLSRNKLISFTSTRFGGQGKMAGKLIDSIINVIEQNDKIVITFSYNAALDQDNRFKAIYEKTNQEDYLKKLQLDKEDFSRQNSAINEFVKNYKNPELGRHDSPLKANKMVSLNGKNGVLNLVVPSGYYLKPSGDVTAYKFGDYQLGSFADNDIYNLVIESGETIASIYVTQSRGRVFKLEDYISSTSYNVILREDNSFYGIRPNYDIDSKDVNIEEHISFRHFSKGDTQIFLIAEIEDEKSAARNRQVIHSIQPK